MQSRRDENQSHESYYQHESRAPQEVGQPFQSQYAGMTVLGSQPSPQVYPSGHSPMNMGHMAGALPVRQHPNAYLDATHEASHMNMAHSQYYHPAPQPYYPPQQQQYPSHYYVVYEGYPKPYIHPHQPLVMGAQPSYQMQHSMPSMHTHAASPYQMPQQTPQPRPSQIEHSQQGFSGSAKLRTHSHGQKGSMKVISAAFPRAEGLAHLIHPQHNARTGIETSSGSTAATAGTMPNAQNASIVPRGPPRKPRQSGHALWVGNLPPNATVVDLKDHFSRGATNEILSLKLMSKSNCAFVNYKTSASCAMAMHRFHNSRFHGNRLVCRLRKASADDVPDSEDRRPSSTLDGLKALAPPLGIDDGEPLADGLSPGDGEARDHKEPPENPSPQPEMEPLIDGEQASDPSARKPESPLDSADQYFVLKSLTLEDLIVSTQTRIWTTQSHNEVQLDAVYKKARNVFLIFSVNKSGEYFGYARMASPVTQLPKDTSESQTGNKPQQLATQHHYSPYFNDQHSPFAEPSDATAAPKSTPTPKTVTAPRGRIIDDLARGTIFWEIDTDEEAEVDGDDTSPSGAGEDALTSTVSRTSNAGSGNCFYLDWISTKRLPFYKTRGMRNAFNGNRDVKIARDGTRLPPEVGSQLLALISHGTTSPSERHPM